MKKKVFALVVALLSLSLLAAQTNQEQIEKIRAESGLDPTRTVTKFGTATWVDTPAGMGTRIQQNLNFQAAIGVWNFTFQTRLYAAINGNDRIFGWTDLETTVNYVPLSFGKHTIGFMAKFSLPTGSEKVSTSQFIITPGLVYVFTPTHSAIIAVQPQYSVSAVKPDIYPLTSILTVRIFAAMFTRSGFAGVIEARPVYDFTAEKFNLVISPIVSYNLGKGFAVNALLEIPVMKDYWEKDGILYKFGVQKSF